MSRVDVSARGGPWPVMGRGPVPSRPCAASLVPGPAFCSEEEPLPHRRLLVPADLGLSTPAAPSLPRSGQAAFGHHLGERPHPTDPVFSRAPFP